MGKGLADSLDHLPSSHWPRASTSSSTASLLGDLRNALMQGRGSSLKRFEVKIQRQKAVPSQTLPSPSPHAPTELGR